ncbi:undecaprenyl-diphosphate phosphatase [Paludibacteraceae bacterium OttesenSCG-928-F17]|nr:undecaprenyl-diphosphate phosphatase [Paludibacteraceae bacterium OttesenSCG-928-F17]
MSWLEALILGIVQGLTEFLPVSSSGHLTIAQELLNLNTSAAENLQFDVIVHAATVLSTIVILWKEIEYLFKGTFCTKAWNDEKSYVLKLIISMIPVLIVGLFFKDYVVALFGQGLLLVGICLMITALLLAFAYFAKPRQKEKISYRDSFIIGLSQAVAVLPGLSRSGTTIATGLLLGNKKENVAQFSFLMVLVPILGETLLNVIDMVKEPASMGVGIVPLIVGFLGAFIAGCFACKFMINLVKRGKLIYFAIYCAIIGAVSIVFSLI